MAEEKKWWRDFGMGQKVFEVLANNVGKELLIFDTETTGFSPTENHIIQISAKKCIIDEELQFHEIQDFDTYINPGYKLPKKIIQITGITDELLADKKSEAEQFDTIFAFFGERPIVCGHNAPFDVGMFGGMYARYCKVFDPIILDTLTMAKELHRKQETKNHKLSALAEYFGLDYGLTFHNSMDDVTATMRLCRMFIEEYKERKEADKDNELVKIPTKIKSCWAWTGYRGMQRLYVRVRHEDRVIWINQRRPYEWGEKDVGSLELFDMEDIERQVLALYGCATLEELSKVRESKYARY